MKLVRRTKTADFRSLKSLEDFDWQFNPSISRKQIFELAAGQYQGGGTEVFYGEGRENRIALDQGDALIFPSFIMHRALPVLSGTRWTLVSWLTGPAPLK